MNKHLCIQKEFSNKLVFWSALLVGTLDLCSAYIDVYLSTGRNSFPIVSKYIASGIMGQQAFSGGSGTILLGIISHYVIAALFTIFFFWLYSRLPLLRVNRLLTGVLYGIFVWVIMALIVLPLSNTPPRKPFEAWKVLKAATILVFMIGIPLSFIAARYYKKSQAILSDASIN